MAEEMEVIQNKINTLQLEMEKPDLCRKKFDELYEKALKLPPSPERTVIYKQMKEIFVQDLPWIPNIHRKAYVLYHGWIENYKRHAIINGEAKYIRVNLNQKAKLAEKL